jgi:predicted HD superfamily hydrolase involved in NAD metabolism
VKIAKEFVVDEEKARLAGLLHDLAKEIHPADLYRIAIKNGIPLEAADVRHPKKLHDRVGAIIARDELGIEDEEILSAIRTHRKGGPNMSEIAMVTLLADKTERKRDKAQRRKILDSLMVGGLRQGVLTALGIKNKTSNPELIKTIIHPIVEINQEAPSKLMLA